MRTLRLWMVGLGVLMTGVGTTYAVTPADSAAAQVMVARRADYRASIRAMPLLERPNRPGHFYGNTVRRLHHLSGFESDSGVYLP